MKDLSWNAEEGSAQERKYERIEKERAAVKYFGKSGGIDYESSNPKPRMMETTVKGPLEIIWNRGGKGRTLRVKSKIKCETIIILPNVC
jgi:hypothetical protein